MRKILFITGSRGEYGYIRPILRLMELNSALRYEIVATNMHLLPEFGSSYKAFLEDGFSIKYKTLNTLAGYTPSSMMKSLSVFGLSITDILDHEKPDIILLAGDRGEQFIAAMAGAHIGIPVAHIQAGEVSGNIDGMTRHAIARYAHIHFAANKDAAVRLERSGEQLERIFNVGAPQLDEFVNGVVSTAIQIEERFNIDVSESFILLVQHPVTEEFASSGHQMDLTIKALLSFDMKIIIIAPNSDAGTVGVGAAIEENMRPNMHVYRNIDRADYAGLMARAAVIVGNSSSGLLEAPSFELPCVNIGRRQLGRVQGENVINCGYDRDEIVSAIDKAMDTGFKESLNGMKNPYGDGDSSNKIVKVLEEIEINEFLLNKTLTY